MATNVATNFPPQTYSSQFFLNTLCDEVGPTATTSKKRSKNSPDGAESSNAVLDCFISTMRTKITKIPHLLILMVLLLQISLSTAQKKYTCVDGAHTTIRTFDNILEFQRNSLKFAPNNNYISFKTITIAHLQKNDFISLDSNHIRKIILNNKRIELIDSGTFNELYCVKYLLLQDNLISKLSNGTFEGLYSLQELHLSGNDIREIPNGSFWNLKHLLKLDLSKNNINQLYDGSFQYLRSLWELRLDHNLISDLPLGLFSFSTHLRGLYLGNNKIIVPSSQEYSTLNNLDILDLQSNQIQTLGYQAFITLSKLTELDLQGNQLIELNFTELPDSLERINLMQNKFQCTYLIDLVAQIVFHEKGLIINDNIENKKVDVNKIGCYNGTDAFTPLPTTTTEKPWFTKPSRGTTRDSIIIPTTEPSRTSTVGIPDDDQLWRLEKENRGLFKAVTDLTTVIVILIILLVMFHVIDIIIRTNTFERCRRRFQRREQPVIHFRGLGSAYSDSSYPLLQR